MADDKRIDKPTGTETVGHEWDGIEELDTPMPRWWLWTFYLTIAFSIGYVVVYPAIPLADRGTEGLWGWSSRGELAAETAAAESGRAELLSRLAATPVEALGKDPELMRAAVAGGRAAFGGRPAPARPSAVGEPYNAASMHRSMKGDRQRGTRFAGFLIRPLVGRD